MSEFLAFGGLLLLCGAWLSLPLLPALLELRRQTDVAPLRVVREYDGNVEFFARSFEFYVQEQLAVLPASAPPAHNPTNLQLTPSNTKNKFEDGTPFWLVNDIQLLVATLETKRERVVHELVLTEKAFKVPSQVIFVGEMLARHALQSEDNVVFRALLAQEEVRLGASNTVLRWLHAKKTAHIGAFCTLYGRASSDQSLVLGRDTRFQRLHAPTLVFGNEMMSANPNLIQGQEHLPVWIPEDAREVSPRYFFASGDVRIPPGHRFEGNLVTTGEITVGLGSFVTGNLKSHHDLVVESNSQIEGSIVSATQIRLGTGAQVAGPIIAEKFVAIEGQARVGTPEKLTTVSAPYMEILPGARVHGTAWAREVGCVGLLPNTRKKIGFHSLPLRREKKGQSA